MEQSKPFEDPIHTSSRKIIRDRIAWLLLGLLGALVAASIVRSFEDALRKDLSLAFFIPAVVYMADAVGTQTETIFIRGLSQGWLRKKRFLLREILVGATIGALIGGVSFVVIALWFGDIKVAAAVGFSMFVTIVSAVVVATLIPWMFWRLKRDPALGSGPFATIIQDVLSLLIYFLIASAVLFGQVF